MKLDEIIRAIPDYPKPGVIFRDITTVLKNAEAFKLSIDEMTKAVSGIDFDLILGTESRGFIFGTPLAYNLGKGFVPVRKAGKLPYKKLSKSYSLEYGEATVEIHEDAIEKGQRVLIVDDLLATGGTAKATAELAAEMGGVVAAMCFLVELAGLGGREVNKDYVIKSILTY
ncbi:adenine phosphoribosyltransferase [Clostridia bacterium]|nr:adenine phosphoribosyltransferase [Clostridia bacterium]